MAMESESVQKLINLLTTQQKLELQNHLSQVINDPELVKMIRSEVEKEPRNRTVFITGLGKMNDCVAIKEFLEGVFSRFGEIQQCLVNDVPYVTPPFNSLGSASVTFKEVDASLRALDEPEMKLEGSPFGDITIELHQAA